MGVTPSAATSGSSSRSRTRSKGGLSFEHDVTGDGDRRRITINQRVDPSESDRITVAESDGLAYGDVPSVPDLPACGDEYDSCGELFHGLFCPCPDCLETQEVGQTCKRSTCPRCWKSWAFRRARTNVAKLESLRAERERERSGWQKFHHITISFRPDVRVRSDDPVKQLRKVTQALLDQIGVDTGFVAFHNYRIKKEYRGDVLGHSSGSGDMAWKDVLAKLESDEWPAEAVYDEFLEYAPHFHVFAVSEFVQTGAVTEQIADETGVVIHRITDNSGTSLETIDDLAAALMYSLSHAGLECEDDGTRRARYQAFGDLATHSADDWALGKADDACRKSSPDVIGLSIAKPECDARLEPDDEESDAGDSAPSPSSGQMDQAAIATDGGGSPRSPSRSRSRSTALPSSDSDWDAGSNTGFSAGSGRGSPTTVVQEAVSVTAPSRGDLERCGTTLRPIRLAGAVLDRDDVREQADPDALENLRVRYEEYVDLGKPSPVTDPPDD